MEEVQFKVHRSSGKDVDAPTATFDLPDEFLSFLREHDSVIVSIKEKPSWRLTIDEDPDEKEEPQISEDFTLEIYDDYRE